MKRFILAVAVFAIAACDGHPDAAPAPLTAATQPMTVVNGGMAVNSVPGEDALWATGDHGVVATGSAYEGVVGVGAPGAAGAWFRSGTAPTATDPQVGIWSTGAIKFQDTPAPAANVPIANAVTPGNIIGASVRVRSNGAGGIEILGGFNVASASVLPTGAARVVFAHPFATANYVCVTSADGGYVSSTGNQTHASIEIVVSNLFSAADRTVSMVCTGAQ